MTVLAVFSTIAGKLHGPPLGAAVAMISFGAATAFVPADTIIPQHRRAEVSQPSAPQGSVAELVALTENTSSVLSEAEAALQANAGLPLRVGALQSALPFQIPIGLGDNVAFNAQSCLALAMYYEAAYEGADGRRAVAQVVLNRVRHPAFPNDVCSVVFQRSTRNVCQFTFACDGAMRRRPEPALWRQSYAEAGEALRGKVYAPVGMATHYHADYVFPYWAPKLDKVAVIGRHLFYRWPRGWGLRGAFTAKYSGVERGPTALVELLQSEAPEVTMPDEAVPLVQEVAPIRSQNEGGFVDTTKGWVPRVSRQRADGEAASGQTAPTAPLP